MVRVSVQLADELKTKVEQRAADLGHASVESYIEALVREDAEWDDVQAPRRVSFGSREEFEAKIIEGLNSPATEMTEGQVQQAKERLLRRHRRAG